MRENNVENTEMETFSPSSHDNYSREILDSEHSYIDQNTQADVEICK